MMKIRTLENNLPLLMLLAFLQVFMVIIPVAVPFFQSKGLSMAEVFQLQALFSAVVVLFEVPSGYFADRCGRRCTLVLGALFLAIGYSALLQAEGFAGLALFELAMGIGISLISGADVALLYDSALAIGRNEEQQQQSLGNLSMIHAWSEGLAAIGCGLLLTWGDYDALLLVQFFVGLLPLPVALLLLEPPRTRALSLEPIAEGAEVASSANGANGANGAEDAADLSFRVIFRHLWLGENVLRFTFLVIGLWSLTTFYAVWLLQKYWELEGVPLECFGYLWALCSLVLGVAGRFAPWLERRFGAPWVLVVVGALPIPAYLALAYGPLILGLAAGLLFYVSRGVGMVVLRHAFNRRLPGSFRATANSLASFLFRGAFVLTGPWVGFALDLWGMGTVFQLLAAGSALLLLGLVLPLALAVFDLQRLEAAGADAQAHGLEKTEDRPCEGDLLTQEGKAEPSPG